MILFGESDVECAGRVELDVDSRFFQQFSRERRIQIAALTRQIEKLVLSVGFDLRQ